MNPQNKLTLLEFSSLGGSGYCHRCMEAGECDKSECKLIEVDTAQVRMWLLPSHNTLPSHHLHAANPCVWTFVAVNTLPSATHTLPPPSSNTKHTTRQEAAKLEGCRAKMKTQLSGDVHTSPHALLKTLTLSELGHQSVANIPVYDLMKMLRDLKNRGE